MAITPLRKIKKIRRSVNVGDTVTIKNSSLKVRNCGFSYLNDIHFLGIEAKADHYTLRVLATIASQAKVIWDVGANIGIDTIYVKSKHPAVKVFAFEPLPKPHNDLTSNIALNNLKEVYTYPYALSNFDGETKFYFDRERTVSGSLNASEAKISIEVSVRKGDSLIISEGASIPDFIKIDVEGSEGDVIRGLQQQALPYKPTLLVEVLTRQGGISIEKALPDGYVFYAIVEEQQKLETRTALDRISRTSLNYLCIHQDKLASLDPIIESLCAE